MAKYEIKDGVGIIPEGTKKIVSDAFENCKKLKSVVIQAGLNKIYDRAFANCTSLETVTFPIGVKSFGVDVFTDCTALKTIYVPAKKADYYKKRLPSELHSLIVELSAEKKEKK